MREHTFVVTVDDNVRLHSYRWSGDESIPPKAVVQIVHGMAEHAARYRHVAEALVTAGYVVYAHDQRGHGKSAPTEADLGYFSDEDGWQRALDDIYAINRYIERERPTVPIFLVAHSMGSMMARDYLTQHGDTITATVLSGTSAPSGLLAKIGALIARAERLRVGARGHSALLERMSTGEYNRAFKPNRTDHDWLSRDTAEVDRYAADPRCGFMFTVQGWIDVLHGVQRIEDPTCIARIPPKQSVLLMSGARDPLGKDGKGIEQVATLLRNAGLRTVDVKLYPDARHEIFNELNRDEVIADMVTWLNARL